jgi:hypothetical protein
MSAVRIGRVVVGGKLHLAVGSTTRCPVLAHRNITADAKPSAVQPETLCGHCAREANLLRVEQANARTGSTAVDAMLERLATTEQQARSAELAARWHAAHPIEIPAEPVHELSELGEFAARLGTLPQRHSVAPTAPSRRKRLNIHRSFAPAA